MEWMDIEDKLWCIAIVFIGVIGVLLLVMAARG